MTSLVLDLLFGGMEKLGPGDNAVTKHVLGLLPVSQFREVVDAGCGTGRQTLVLAKALGALIHATDNHQPFLDDLMTRAQAAGLAQRIQTFCMDMADIPRRFTSIDLLWSEGAAYSIGFGNALASWQPALSPRGYAVVSELSWLTAQPPHAVRHYFDSGYPEMRAVPDNVALAKSAGYNVLNTHTLPDAAWLDGYYSVLEPRAQSLLSHENSAVREAASEMLREIEIFRIAQASYGYVFYVLQRND